LRRERTLKFIEIRDNKDLLLINALSVLLILAVALVPESPLRTVLGIPFVLFFPGYALVSSLFPGKMDLDGVERLALSIGLSLAVVPLIGLALNYTPWGIRLQPTMASLFLFTLVMSLLSAYRRGRLRPDLRYNPFMHVKVPRWSEMKRADKLIAVGFVAGIVAVGGLTAYLASSPKVGERFTEFYVLGSSGKIADYPTNLTLGESGTVILGIVNHEYENVTYRIVVKLDNETIATINNIALGHGMKWEQNFTFTLNKTGEKMKLEFILFREGLDEPYRNLHLWITVRPRE